MLGAWRRAGVPLEERPMVERRRRARGEQTRVQVLEATLRLLAREGPRGVTHRAVAAEGGTSVRATTYYFESREQLLAEALQHYAETAIARFDALTGSLESLPSDPAELIERAADLLTLTVLSDLGEDRVGLIAEYELVLETTRNPAIEETYRRWQERLETMLSHFAERIGSDDPSLDARLALATLRGLEIEALARPSNEPSFADLRSIFRRLLAGVRCATATSRQVHRADVQSA